MDPANIVQDIYNRAYQHRQKHEIKEAKALIDQALALAPEDLEVHLLAGHLKWPDGESQGHFEFILDKDIHYRDTLHKENPHRFVQLLACSYALSLPSWRGVIDEKVLARLERYGRYFDLVLRAGRPARNFYGYLQILLELRRFDEIIDLGEFVAGRKTGADMGLPGLEEDDANDDSTLDQDPGDHVMTAYFYAGRHQEGFEWIKGMVEQYPSFARYRIMLAEAHGWLGRPEEAAREYILACREDFDDNIVDSLQELAHLTADPLHLERECLKSKLLSLHSQIPPEKKEVFDEIYRILDKDEGQAASQLGITTEYIESQLNVSLPPGEQNNLITLYDRLWLPWTVTSNPLIKAAFAKAAQDKAQENERKGKSKQREKVAVGVVAGSGGQTYTIERYGVDLTDLARKGKLPPIVGRESEIARMIRVLGRMEKNNPALLGEAGVGKTAVVHGLAQRIARDEVPEVLRGKRVIELNMGVLVAGTTYRGDFEKRITDIVREARDNPDVLIFVDELHTVIGAGGTWKGDMDASNMIKPALAKGDLRLIGATTSREFSRSIERDPALERRFSPLLVRELDGEASLLVLQARRDRWEGHHGVIISDKVLAEAIALSEARVSHRKLPDKAIDLVDEACSFLRARLLPSQERPALSGEDLRQVVAEWTGGAVGETQAPEGGKKQPEPLSLAGIGRQIRETLVGQDEAVGQISEIVVDLRLSLKDPTLPTMMLFVGPVGVGKTEAARALARVLWPGEDDRLLVVNMEDLSDSSHLGRLIGVPVGYAGHEETGLLSLRLRRQPHSLVYLRNFTSAHPRVQDLFGTIFREGCFTDARGEVIVVHDTVFILSVALDQRQGMGFAPGRKGGDMLGMVERDERLRGILSLIPYKISFHVLGEGEVREVIRLHLGRLARRLEGRLEVGDELVERVTRAFLDLPVGERNLAVLINREVIPGVRGRILGEPSR